MSNHELYCIPYFTLSYFHTTLTLTPVSSNSVHPGGVQGGLMQHIVARLPEPMQPTASKISEVIKCTVEIK